MKKVSLALSLVIAAYFISCTNFSNEKKFFVDTMQSYKGTTLDLNIQFHEFKKVGTITYLDSLNYHLPIYATALNVKATTAAEFATRVDEFIGRQMKLSDSHTIQIDQLKHQLDSLEKTWESTQNLENITSRNDVQGKIIDLESKQNKLSKDIVSSRAYQKELLRLDAEKEKEIAGIYKVNYTAFNTDLNTNQTIDTYFLINSKTDLLKPINDYIKSD